MRREKRTEGAARGTAKRAHVMIHTQPELKPYAITPGNSRGREHDEDLASHIDPFALDRQRVLAQSFEEAIEARGAEVQVVRFDESEDGFTLTATIIYFEGNELTSEEMADIQQELSQMAEAPVAIQATFLLGRRAELEAVGRPIK